MNRGYLNRGIRAEVHRQFAAPRRNLEVLRLRAVMCDGRRLTTANREPFGNGCCDYFYDIIAGRQVRNRVGAIDDIDHLGNASGRVIVAGRSNLEIRPTRNVRHRTVNGAGLALRRKITKPGVVTSLHRHRTIRRLHIPISRINHQGVIPLRQLTKLHHTSGGIDRRCVALTLRINQFNLVNSLRINRARHRALGVGDNSRLTSRIIKISPVRVPVTIDFDGSVCIEPHRGNQVRIRSKPHRAFRLHVFDWLIQLKNEAATVCIRHTDSGNGLFVCAGFAFPVRIPVAINGLNRE